jgi:tRNA G18 (ribose-2'-O)-methylase SpoU
VLEGVANPDNMGGVFRNAAAFGVDAVLLGPGCCDPLYRKAVRTSMAATLRVPYARTRPGPDRLDEIRAAQFALVALTPRLVAEPLEAFASRPLPQKLAFLVGAEGPGLDAEIEAAADYRVAIPLEPGVDSLNLAVAIGIVLYQLRVARVSIGS